MRRFFFLGRRSRGGTAGPLTTRGLWFFRGEERPVYLFGAGTASLYGHDVEGDEPPQTPWTEKRARQALGRHLGRLRESGINLLRVDPWAFCWDERGASPWTRPFRTSGNFYEPFFALLRWLCREAGRHDVCVQLIVFDDATLSIGGALGGPWLRHPWNARCGSGPCAHPADFYDISNEAVRAVQEAWAARLFSATGDLPNVLYEVASEVGASLGGAAAAAERVGPWLRHHLSFAREKAPGRPRGVSGSSWSDENHGGSAEPFWHEPDLDVLLPHEHDGRELVCREEAARHFVFYTREQIDKPRVVGEAVFRSASAADDARRALWTAFASGGQVSLAGGLNTSSVLTAGEAIAGLRAFLSARAAPRWWEMRPVPIECVLAVDPARAYALGSDEGERFVYFLEPPEGPIRLAQGGEVRAVWVDPASGIVTPPVSPGASGALIFPPSLADAALWVRPASEAKTAHSV